MATTTLRSTTSIEYDEYDLLDNRVIGIHNMLNPSVEFYLKNLTGISKAVIVGAGIGVYSKILDEAGAPINVKDVNGDTPVDLGYRMSEHTLFD